MLQIIQSKSTSENKNKKKKNRTPEAVAMLAGVGTSHWHVKVGSDINKFWVLF